MDEVTPYIGRLYKIFEYVADAEEVCVLMGSGATTINEAVDLLATKRKKVGAVLVHLYRPWCTNSRGGPEPPYTLLVFCDGLIAPAAFQKCHLFLLHPPPKKNRRAPLPF